MNKLKIKLCDVMIKHYQKRWKNALDNAKKHGRGGVVTDEYRRWFSLATEYGKKSLLWINKKDYILKGSK